MERLGASDLGAVIEVARELGEIRDVDGFRMGVLALLQRLVACDSASFNEVSPATGEAVIASVDPADSVWEDSAQLLGTYAHQNPLIAAFQRSSDARVLKFSDFVTRRQLHQLEIYDLVYRRIAVEHQVAFVLPAPDARVIGFALNRERGDFSERDRAILRTARPFFVRAYEDAAERELLRASIAALERDADNSAPAVILVDSAGRIKLASEAAMRWLRQLGATPDHDRLPEPLASWVLAQIRCTRSAGERVQLVEPMMIQTPDGVLTARLVPGVPGQLDLVVLQGERRALSRSDLSSIGLTHRESEVLALVADGHSNTQVARALGIREPTVAKHLQHVYGKLEVTSRTAAVARARQAQESR